jgi:hypothetical protein
MTVQRITTRTVGALQFVASEFTMWDDTVSGFGVRVRLRGSFSPRLLYRDDTIHGSSAPGRIKLRTRMSLSLPPNYFAIPVYVDLGAPGQIVPKAANATCAIAAAMSEGGAMSARTALIRVWTAGWLFEALQLPFARRATANKPK